MSRKGGVGRRGGCACPCVKGERPRDAGPGLKEGVCDGGPRDGGPCAGVVWERHVRDTHTHGSGGRGGRRRESGGCLPDGPRGCQDVVPEPRGCARGPGARRGGAPLPALDPAPRRWPRVWPPALCVAGPRRCLPQGQHQGRLCRPRGMAGITRCFLMRCGVLGRRPGARASPRWPQLPTPGPGTGRKLRCRGVWLTRDQRQFEAGPGGGSSSAGLARAHGPWNACRRPGGL